MIIDDKYNVSKIIREHDIIYFMHRNKLIKHVVYKVIYKNSTELRIYIPHYFESIGLNKKIKKELEKDYLKRRFIKIQRLRDDIKKT